MSEPFTTELFSPQPICGGATNNLFVPLRIMASEPDDPAKAGRWMRDQRIALGWSGSEMASRINGAAAEEGDPTRVSQQVISKFEKAANKRKPAWVRYAAKAFDAARDKPAEAKYPNQGKLPTPEVLEDHDIELVRQVDISYAMGDGAIIDDYPEVGAMPFNRAFLKSITRSPSERLFMATGQGDSMTPTLLKDDLVLVDTNQKRVTEQDRIWALSYAGVGMIKRLRVSPGKVTILSDNPAVPPDEADPQDIFIVGKVVWVGRRM